MAGACLHIFETLFFFHPVRTKERKIGFAKLKNVSGSSQEGMCWDGVLLETSRVHKIPSSFLPLLASLQFCIPRVPILKVSYGSSDFQIRTLERP
jgi:hypothetical protein